VEALLHKHALVEEVVHKQELPREDRHALVDTFCTSSISPSCAANWMAASSRHRLHSRSTSIEQRSLVWDLVKSERDGEILIEVPTRCASR